MGPRVDLHQDGDERDVRPDLGEHLAGPQQPEVALAPRREVDGERRSRERDVSDATFPFPTISLDFCTGRALRSPT
jgi:hypothetical protein